MAKAKKVTLGLVQTAVSENLDQNLKHTVQKIRQAAKRGAQIICLQELCLTPYFPQQQKADVNKYCEPIPGKTTKVMSALAKDLGAVLIVPICEYDKKGKYYNTAAVFNEQGKMLGKYRKNHIPHDPGFYEKDYFEHGNLGYKVFKTKFADFAVLICFDQWFPEAARMARLAGAEIIFYPTAIGNILRYIPPEGNWHDAWELIQRSHGIANSVVIASINRVGIEGNSKFLGQSFISDAFGKLIKRASATKEEVLVATVDLSLNKFVSEGWGFLRNRRPDTYRLNTKKLIISGKKLQPVEHYKKTIKALERKNKNLANNKNGR